MNVFNCRAYQVSLKASRLVALVAEWDPPACHTSYWLPWELCRT